MLFLLFLSLFVELPAAESMTPPDRIICFEPFDNELYEMTGHRQIDDLTCRSMLIRGTVGMCFEGDPNVLVEYMNNGLFDYGSSQRILPGQAQVLSQDLIKFASFEIDLVGWTRDDNELFRCPEFDQIKESLRSLAEALETSVDYGVSRRYREEFGLPDWLQTVD